MSSPLREERCGKCRFVRYCFCIHCASWQDDRFFLEIFRRQMWVRGMGQLRNMWNLMDHNYSGCMTMICNDKNDNHAGHHCCKCCLMISWPDFRCRPSFFMQSFVDIEQGHQVCRCYMTPHDASPKVLHMNKVRAFLLEYPPSPWRDETLFCQVKGATGWSWSMQHLNSSFFQRCHHWNDQTFYPSICV